MQTTILASSKAKVFRENKKCFLKERGNIMKNTTRLTGSDLENVMGGTFDPNMFEEGVYNGYGIRTKYHTFSCDEFWLPDGTKTNERGANNYIKQVDPEYYDKVAMSWSSRFSY